MNEKIHQLIDNSIIIGPSELQSYFLLERNKEPSLNFSYKTKESVLKEIFGDYNQKAIKEMMKTTGKSYDLSKKILSYLSSGYDKTDEYKFLYDKKLIICDPYYEGLYKNKKVIFLVYSKDDPEIKHIINKLKLTNYEFINLDDLDFLSNDRVYHVFNDVGEEVRFVLNEICHQIDKEKKKPSDFLIYCNKDTYSFYLDVFSKYYNLPINIDNSYSLYDTLSAKIILNNLDEDFLTFINDNSRLFEHDKNNLDIIKYLYEFYDLKNDNNYVIDLVSILKDYPIHKESFVEAVKVIDSISFDSNKTIYFLGANDDFVPRVYDNNDVLDDEEKENHFLTTSVIKNDYTNKITKAFMTFKKVVNISYVFEDDDSVPYMLKSLNFKKADGKIVEYQYSKEISDIYFSNYLYRYNYFNEINPELAIDKNSLNRESLFEHKYSTIKREKDRPEYSYTSIETYSECPFKYYLNYILKLNVFESTTSSEFGKYAHQIMEHVYDENFDFNSVSKTVLKDYDFSPKELVFLNRFNKEIEKVTDNVISINKMKPLKKTYNEYKLKVSYDNYDVTGQIDRINVYDDALLVIDYKTGSYGISVKNFELRRTDLQLPTYLYLIKKDPEFSKYKVIGSFIQVIPSKGFYNFIKPTKEDEKSQMLQGFINKDNSIYMQFDSSVENGDKSSVVNGVYMSKTGVTKRTGAFTTAQFDNYVKVTEGYYHDFNDSIQNNDFIISPLKTKNPCLYCNFHDICFCTNDDIRDIKDGSNEDEEEQEYGDDEWSTKSY